MLGLLQVMTYMMQSGHSEDEIRDLFSEIESGEGIDFAYLLNALGLELSPTSVERSEEVIKLGRWTSALSVTLMRLGA